MTRIRLRPRYSDEELKRIYATPHDHTKWADHHLRVEMTISLASWTARQFSCTSIADLSCGDGTIVKCLAPTLPSSSVRAPFSSVHLGDFAPGYQYTGPIEKTIHQVPNVDMFICSETVEHLDDPDTVLWEIGQVAETLIVSTPIGETTDVRNPEHYWGWDVDDVTAMLENAGWDRVNLTTIHLPGWTYDYQIHACRRRP